MVILRTECQPRRRKARRVSAHIFPGKRMTERAKPLVFLELPGTQRGWWRDVRPPRFRARGWLCVQQTNRFAAECEPQSANSSEIFAVFFVSPKLPMDPFDLVIDVHVPALL